MVKNQQTLPIDVDQAFRLRTEAAGLLQRLEESQRASEQICAEAGKRDAMRFVTGCTAIEHAIEATRAMIRRMDHLLQEAEEQFGDSSIAFDVSVKAPGEHTDEHAEQLVESR